MALYPQSDIHPLSLFYDSRKFLSVFTFMWKLWGDVYKKCGTVFHSLRQKLSLPIMTCLCAQLAFSMAKWTHTISGTNYIWKQGLSVFWKWTTLIIQPGLVGYTVRKAGPFQMNGWMQLDTQLALPSLKLTPSQLKGKIVPTDKANGFWGLHVQVLLVRMLLRGYI